MSRMGRAYRRRAAGGRATEGWALTALRSRGLRLLLVVAALAVVVFTVVGVSLLGGSTARAAAPDITLATIDEEEFLLSQRQGEVRLLYFSFPG